LNEFSAMKALLIVIVTITGLLLVHVPTHAQFFEELKIDSTQVPEAEDQKMQITVTDFRTKMFMDADVMIKGLNPRKTVVFKNFTDSTMLLKNYRIYTVSVVKEGFMYYAHKFWPAESSTHYERVELKPLSVGLKTSIEDITFLGDETQLYHKSVPALEELVQFMTVNPSVKICVIGHANCPVNEDKKNSDAYYRRASEKRAEAVVDYLVQHGITADRLTTRGMGNKQMLYPDPQTEWQVSANRRVEIEVTGL
jgi:outer membrane protein OmpA-like peptidoglycan-associated protein